jgi:hypothetical protein
VSVKEQPEAEHVLPIGAVVEYTDPPDPTKADEYTMYRQTVRRLSNQAARLHFKNTKRTRKVHLDHVFSIKEGFQQGVAAEVIGHITNLRFLDSKANQSKSDACGKTLKQLMKDYKQYERPKA